jgi:hypothetical protein
MMRSAIVSLALLLLAATFSALHTHRILLPFTLVQEQRERNRFLNL